MSYTSHQYVLVFIFCIVIYRLKHKNPFIYQKIEQLGPLLYPGPLIQHIETIFLTFLHQVRSSFV